MSGLIWIKTVCKSYQQTTLGDKELSNILQRESSAIYFKGRQHNLINLSFDRYTLRKELFIEKLQICGLKGSFKSNGIIDLKAASQSAKKVHT